MNDLLTMSVKEMRALIGKGELSPVDLLETHIKRVELVNPKLNALIEDRFDEARAEARAAQERLAGGARDLPPLFGVPCTIKDTFGVKGMRWAAGVWARRDKRADEDATTVARLKNAGAIIMGKTNIPEAAMWCETYNHVYGRTNNPYDLGRGCGGSSGGEGSIVAAGGSPFGLGADIGGSIRYPSAFNGVPGHKPTAMITPQTGHWPPAEGNLGRYNTMGPICRRVEDLDLVMKLLIGPDGKDPWTVDHEWTSPDRVNLSELKVYFYDYNGFAKCDDDVRRAVSMAAGALAADGVPVKYWRPEGVEKGVDIWQAGLSENPDPMTRILGDGEPIDLGREVLRFILRRSKITFPGLGAALIEKPGQLLAGRNKKFLDLAWDLREKMEARLGDNGVMLCPVFSKPAPKHTWIWLDVLGIGYSCIYNILGFPATIIPIFHREDGVPVSIQVVGARHKDHLTLAAAARLEKIFGGWRPIEKVG